MDRRQIVIVDDDEEAREAVALYVQIKGWRVATSAGEPVGDLDPDLPTLVLLDYYLGGKGKALRWLQRFHEQYPNTDVRIYLLTGKEVGNELNAFVTEQELAGLVTKPLDLDRLETLLEAPAADSGAAGRPASREGEASLALLSQAADALGPAVRLLDPTTLAVRYQNLSADAHPWDETTRRIVQMPVHHLKIGSQPRAENLGWDAGHGEWVRRRLFRANPVYWLAEERTPTPEGTDPALARISQSSDRHEELKILSEILERQWGITRLRFYRVVSLYPTNGSPRTYILQPSWQQGGGFQPDEVAWLRQEFRMEDNANAAAVFADPQRRFLVSPVDDDDRTTRQGCEGIRWGNASSRAQVPVWDAGRPVGLLALDRRSDHLVPPPHWIEERFWSDSLTEDDMNNMAGLLEAVKPLLRKRVKEHHTERFATWNEILTKAISQATGTGAAKDCLAKTLALGC